MATSLGIAVIAALSIAPRPPVPGRPLAEPPVATAILAQGPTATPARVVRTVKHALAHPIKVMDSTQHEDLAVADQGRSGQGGVDGLYNRLFAGITLTPDKMAIAKQILAKLPQQVMLDQVIYRLNWLRLDIANVKHGRAIVMERDSVLRALLTNDADRARFDAHAQARVPLALKADSAGGPALKLRTVEDTSETAVRAAVEATFKRLFDSISLTREQETKAREEIMKTERETRPVRWFEPRLNNLQVRADSGGPTEIRVRPVAMSQADADSLVALVASPADKAKLQSRIRVVPAGGREDEPGREVLRG